MSLPQWATIRDGGAAKSTRIDVDANAAYEAWLKELRAFYGKHTPREWNEPQGEMKPEFKVMLDELRDGPSQYWLEVCYQSIKLELQLSMRRFDIEIRIHDPGHNWQQAKYPEGRGALIASKKKEAREHFKRLRGMLPG